LDTLLFSPAVEVRVKTNYCCVHMYCFDYFKLISNYFKYI
jgi:hypothetical protein